MKSDDATMAAFAQYLIKFVQAYAQQGIAVEAISPQNEPNYTGNYPTCGWSPGDVHEVRRPVSSARRSPTAGLPTKIMLGTFNGGGSDAAIVGSVMARRRRAQDYRRGARLSVGHAAPPSPAPSRTASRSGRPSTSAATTRGSKPFDASMAPNDQAYAVESWRLIHDWIQAGVTAYSAWNMVLDTVGVGIDTTRVWPQNALLTVDTATKTLNVTPAYYVFRHLSQFVATGAKVVATSGGDALAFRNPDGGVVTVMFNAGPARTMTVAARGKKLRFSMPANGWATIVAR